MSNPESGENVFGCLSVLIMVGVLIAILSGKPNQEVKWVDRKVVETFQYDGHQYIAFRFSRSYKSTAVVHDPDCQKCHNIEIEAP